MDILLLLITLLLGEEEMYSLSIILFLLLGFYYFYFFYFYFYFCLSTWLEGGAIICRELYEWRVKIYYSTSDSKAQIYGCFFDPGIYPRISAGFIGIK